MADISDVSTLLGWMAETAVYPGGLSAASVTGNIGDIRIATGWPVPAQVDSDVAAGKTNISIYPTRAGGPAPFQILDNAYIITPAVHGMTASLTQTASSTTVTLSGSPSAEEYCSIIVEGNAYSRAAAAGNLTAAGILAQIASDAETQYPSVRASGNSITFPAIDVSCNIGAPAIVGTVTHRQRDILQVTVWAPTDSIRDTVAEAVDVYFKAQARHRLVFPDTSRGQMAFVRMEQDDQHSVASVFVRHLLYAVEYATLETFKAYEITTVSTTIDSGTGQAGSGAAQIQTTG